MYKKSNNGILILNVPFLRWVNFMLFCIYGARAVWTMLSAMFTHNGIVAQNAFISLWIIIATYVIYALFLGLCNFDSPTSPEECGVDRKTITEGYTPIFMEKKE